MLGAGRGQAGYRGKWRASLGQGHCLCPGKGLGQQGKTFWSVMEISWDVLAVNMTVTPRWAQEGEKCPMKTCDAICQDLRVPVASLMANKG